jgi:peptidoglycan/LPS O-acetylase OafA/YrhL
MRKRERERESNNNLKNLDLLRSVAVILVFISHILSPNNLPKFFHLQALGVLGVFIFFVLTSYVLMLSLDRQNLSKNKIYYKFYIQRIFRIYPISIIVVILSFFTIYYKNLTEFDPKLFLSNIFLIQNLIYYNELPGIKSIPGVIWTLCYEIQMYIFLPFLFLLTKNKLQKKLIIVLYTLCIIFILINKYFNSPLFNIIKYFPCFISGVLGYIYFKENRIKISCIYLIGYLFLSIIFFPIIVAKNIPENFLGVIFCFILGLLIPFTKEISFKFVNNFSRQIAKYSYTIYLFHGFVINMFINFQVSYLIKISLIILTLSFICYAIYNFIENPMIKLGKKISNGL